MSIKLVNKDLLTGRIIPNTNFANFIDDLSASPLNRLTMAAFSFAQSPQYQLR